MLEEFASSALLALKMLQNSGFEAYLVGGSVRDYLMRCPLGDIDITTNATPEEVRGVFGSLRVIETGIKHGTVTVLIDGKSVEITTYRCEGTYSDNRRPDSVSFSKSFSDDVLRRDFTMNGIGISIDGEIRDEVGGQADIERKIIRAIGKPEERFSEDALRILRAVRFSSVLGFEIEENTENALREKKELLKNISAERKREELLKLINGKNAETVLLAFRDVITVCIPEIQCEFDFDQHNRHHLYDVYTHSVKALANAENDPNIRMALLLHDIGKPQTAKFDKKGEMHFKCHAQVSFEIADKILTYLRFSNADKEEILTLIQYHDIPFLCEDMKEPSQKRIKRIVSKFGKATALKLLEIRRCDNAAQNPEYFLGNDFYSECKKMILDIADSGECLTLKGLAINGNDLLNLGFSGKAIGEILNQLLEKVIDGDLINNKAELLAFAEQMR
ncbi:MAG: HD domain-containing protein [Oscillospiraceae bacterium]|nr:HD domain-containing protein [Oscillospiraceae bacterium]